MNYKELTREHINDELIFAKLEEYVEIIESQNKVMNLTGFKGDVLWKEGILESILTLEAAFPHTEDFIEKKLLDIGAGVGFPSIPFVISHPELELIMFEPQEKRMIFLMETCVKLKLNARVQMTRVEDAKMFNYFDYITARAVAEFRYLCEASIHIGKKFSEYAFIKGPMAKEEIKAAKKIIKILNVSPKIVPVKTIKDKEVNLITYTKKSLHLQGYPRPWKDIVK
ncbi:16S rRNA (guanine(527)-N(7))-methyltransferase RsmG [Candidatus Mycoplasma mahonii]|uniref:16S rRNA (guanine(527)-N(7))-methyltransferase RsmG n=1 Tax=Candidatus Mycoplasma mahonii TaxID=3004105 RepID=UPI0026EBD0A2|nr:16S rRNA (guanine(527)-N(7))-methyltransferase RsmG [Candidatus Mycoplasma mahonii]WKX02430.1 16S rRNA (guanine(527)-N(7))-methyltransferase RsmG [Candidatus Mycoplasma mahonii]